MTIVCCIDHYTDNDPLNKVDPLGLRAQDCNMNAGGCTVVVDDKQLGQVGAPYQGQGPPTGTQGMSWNHFNAASPTKNLSGYALGMLQSGASSDLAVLYHVVRQEAAGRDGGIANQVEDWYKYAGAAACDAGVGPACSRTGGRGLADLSLGITNMQRGAYNTAKSHRCGAGGDDRSWTDLIGDSNYAIAMTAGFLNALDCDVMDYVRARPNQFKVESMGYLSGKTLRRGFQSGPHQLYKYDGDGNRVLSRNALNMFAYHRPWDEVVNVLEGQDLVSPYGHDSWVERQNVAFNENGGGNLSDVYGFYCITGGPFSC